MLPVGEKNLAEAGVSGVRSAPDSPPVVERISTKLPQFWEEVPEVWFAQAEAEFELSKITRERTQYSYLIAALSKEVLGKVLDIIKNPDPIKPYSNLKEQLLNRLTSSEETRLSKLLYHVEIGDRTPSEFYRHMIQLAGNSTDLSMALVKKLWKSRLPKSIEVALIAVDSKDHIEQMRIADRLWECTHGEGISEVHARASVPQDSLANILRREVNELKDMVKKMTFNSNQGPRNRGRSVSRTKQSIRQRTPSNVRKHPFCWYHFRFGNAANRCLEPCNFTASQAANEARNKKN